MKSLISLYISIWYTFTFNYLDKIPKPVLSQPQAYRTFVKYDQNQLFVPYPESSLETFHQAMEDLIEKKRDKLNVVHIGDSHIQADYFPDRLRNHFRNERLLGNGGRGYLFPGSMAGTHNAYNLKVGYEGRWYGCTNVQWNKKCDLGLGGMSASTTSSLAKFTIDPNIRTGGKYPIDRVRIYYQVNNPNSYFVNLVTSQGLVAPQRLDATGYAEFYLDSTQSKVTFQLEKKFAHQNTFSLEGVSLGNNQDGVQYHAVGVNSATVYSFLRSNKLEPHLASLDPDLIIISLGTNDAYGRNFDEENFKKNYARLIQKIKKAVPNASILMSTPGDCALPGGVLNYNNKKARQKIFELAEETDCAVWDLFTIMGGYGSVNYWLKNQLCARDRVHLTRKGYHLQGDLLYDALVYSYADYWLRKAPKAGQ